MPSSDSLPGGTDQPRATADTGAPIELVPLPDSFDLSAFPSEEPDEPAPTLPEPAVEVPVSASPAPQEHREQHGTEAGNGTMETAAVLDFPTPLAEPVPHVAPSIDDAHGHVTLSDLIRRRDRFGWREAIAVMYRLSLRLQDDKSHPPLLLQPDQIDLTNDGGVHVRPGPRGGDPLVVQLGRLVQTMVAGKATPPDVRLLVSQATFEVPTFKSVHELALALQQIGGLDQDDSARAAFAVAAQPAPAVPPGTLVRSWTKPGPPLRPILPVPMKRAGRGGARRVIFSMDGLLIGCVLVAGAIIAGLVLMRLSSSDTPQTTTRAVETTGPSAPAPAPTPATTPGTVQAPGAPPAAAAVNPAATTGSAARPPRPAQPNGRTRGTATQNGTVEHHVVSTNPSGTPSRPAPPGPSPSAIAAARETERRAAALIAEGQTQQAAMIFDALVMANPLYEPRNEEITPEALAAFRASRKVLLPAIAARDYDRAKSALSAGDPDHAMALGNQVIAILDRLEGEPAPNLRRNTVELIEKAGTAQLSAEDIVYSERDAGVVPPRLLSRGFPSRPPFDVPPNRVGKLDVIVGKAGDVEFLKLYTPLNRYHERVIVPAVKAWRYKPAMKNGKAVRFRLSVTINLPESGTDPY